LTASARKLNGFAISVIPASPPADLILCGLGFVESGQIEADAGALAGRAFDRDMPLDWRMKP
jgi:hypothetical protein